MTAENIPYAIITGMSNSSPITETSMIILDPGKRYTTITENYEGCRGDRKVGEAHYHDIEPCQAPHETGSVSDEYLFLLSSRIRQSRAKKSADYLRIIGFTKKKSFRWESNQFFSARTDQLTVTTFPVLLDSIPAMAILTASLASSLLTLGSLS